MKTSLQDQKPIKSNRSNANTKLSIREKGATEQEQRLLTNQQDQSYVMTVVNQRMGAEQTLMTNKGQDSYSAIQDEAKFTLDDGQNSSQVSFKGYGSPQSHKKHEKINNIQQSHLLKMISAEGNINYSNQNLSEVPKQLTAACFRQVQGLDLSNNLISQVSEQLMHCLPCLASLILSSNKITFLTPAIKRQRQLKVLKINSNCLTMLPNEIGDLLHLEELDASDNKLYGLPDSLSNCTQMRILNLAHNQIKYMPPELDSLQKLEILNIESNLFSSFPCSYGRLESLKEFSLDWFKYMNPPLPTLIQIPGFQDMLRQLCESLIQQDKFECELIDFLKFFSEGQIEINQVDSRNRSLLHNACSNGDLGVIRAFIRSGADLNILDKDDCTPLCIAIRDFQFEAAKLLIESGADVNMGGGIYGSALHLAVVRTNLQLTEMMIKRGSEVNVTDSDGNTPLHFIMNVFSKNETKYMAIAESLVMSGAKPNCKNKELWAPLHIAARKGQIEGIKWAKTANEILKELGMECFDFNMSGGSQKWTALHLSGYSGHNKVVEELLSGSMDYIRKFPINVYARNMDAKTPRQCTKGNLVLTKIFRKAEKRYLKEIFEIDQVNETQLITNHNVTLKNGYNKHHHHSTNNTKPTGLEGTNFIPLRDQLQGIKHKIKYEQSKQKRSQPAFQKLGKKILLEKSLRLDVSKIIDMNYSDDDDGQTNTNNDALKDSLKSKQIMAINEMSKKIIKGDQDPRNSIFYDLMKSMSPRSIGLKLQFYKGSKGVVAAGLDLDRFQNHLNESLRASNMNAKNIAYINGQHINIFYLKDKILENKVLYERFEAISILYQQGNHQNFEQMIKQLIERIPLIVGDITYRSILDQVIKLIVHQGHANLVEITIQKLKSIKQNESNGLNDHFKEDLDDYLFELQLQKSYLEMKLQREKKIMKDSRIMKLDNPVLKMKHIQHQQSMKKPIDLAAIDLNMANKVSIINGKINQTPTITQKSNKYFSDNNNN